jgi:DNA-binding response OmpR family regulator
MPTFSILLIDDNNDFVEFLKFLLSHHGYDIYSAHSGLEGLAELRTHPVDLVILDVMMPNMSGLEVCAEIRRMDSSLPVILLTAKDDLATRSAAIALGASEFIAKPVNIDDLLTRVRTQCHVSHWDKSIESTMEATELAAIAKR